jgi:hypothetical protein
MRDGENLFFFINIGVVSIITFYLHNNDFIFKFMIINVLSTDTTLNKIIINYIKYCKINHVIQCTKCIFKYLDIDTWYSVQNVFLNVLTLTRDTLTHDTVYKMYTFICPYISSNKNVDITLSVHDTVHQVRSKLKDWKTKYKNKTKTQHNISWGPIYANKYRRDNQKWIL